MKRTFYILFLGITFSSCNKNDDDSRPTPTQTTNSDWSFTATVNGVELHADSTKGYFYLDTSFTPPLREIVVWAFCGNKQIIPGFRDSISSNSITGINYTHFSDGARMVFYDLNDSINTYDAIDASFKITSVDTINKKISGSFEGIVAGDISGDTTFVTNGSFTNISYQVL